VINEDAPTMSAGTGGFSGSANASGPVAGFDPMLGSNNEKKPKLTKRKYKRKNCKEEVLDERLGGKGYSKKATKGGGDWEDSDRGAGNKATRRAGGKVKVKSPTYIAHVKNKNVKEGLVVGHVTPKSEKENDRYLPFKVCYDGAQEYVLYGKSEADIKIQLRKIYRPENHKKIYVKRLYPNQVIKFYYDLRMKALKNQ
jgi:hypothetical protein